MSAPAAGSPLEQARERMRLTRQWNPAQNMGRSWPIGCVALEITQRCNLDCTLCYLSGSSETVKDLPLEEIFRRIDRIVRRYGRDTNVQITGGEPTLRRGDELLAIVRRACAAGLRPALFTNGIRATRVLLEALCEAGLAEVAFHVDTTQQRTGFVSEAALHALRERYLERTRGLPLAVYFNTTVHDANFHEVAALARFFVAHAEQVRIASFQLQADTGRGVLGRRSAAITLDSVTERICEGVGADLDFGALQAGHARCNRYAMALVVNGKVYDALDDREFVHWAMQQTAGLRLDRARPGASFRILLGWLLRNPGALPRSLGWAARKAWQARRDLAASRGRVGKLSFFVHNFMDARALDPERVGACVFSIATEEGPMSMCLYNAERDRHILKPLEVREPQRIGFWDPLTGRIEERMPPALAVRHSRKTARGRVRALPDHSAVGSVEQHGT